MPPASKILLARSSLVTVVGVNGNQGSFTALFAGIKRKLSAHDFAKVHEDSLELRIH